MNRITRLAAELSTAAVLIGVCATAASASVTGNYTGTGIEISPTRVEIHLNAQGKATQTYTVEDPGSKPAMVTVSLATFSQQPNGQLAVAVPNLPGSVTGIGWVTTSVSKLRLLPGQIRHVTVHIAEPAGASPGQRYVAVEFVASTPTRLVAGKGQVASHIAVAGEMLIDTPGALRSTASYGLLLPSISFGGPVTLTATVKATGNEYVWLHNEHAALGSKAIKLPSAVALAGSERTITTSFLPGVGLDHVTWQGQTATIIVLPGKLLLILLGALLLMGGGFMWLRSMRRHASSRRHGRKPVTAGGAA